jgi:Uma2 family endonuclease
MSAVPAAQPRKLTEEEFEALLSDVMVEYTDGFIETLPMPTMLHQEIMIFLYLLLDSLKDSQGRVAGKAMLAPFILQVRSGKLRLPDVLYLKRENFARIADARWDYADLIMEIVSDGGVDRDYVQKRFAYAEAHVPEYWIVDPFRRSITLLVLELNSYREAAVFTDGQRLVSPTIPGLAVDVSQVFNRPHLPE